MTDEPDPTGADGAPATVGRRDRATDGADADGSTPTVSEYTVAFSPRNVAVGLAIVAGLVGLLVRRRRRSKGS